MLSGKPGNVVLGDNVTGTLKCIVDDDIKFIAWKKDDKRIANIKKDCVITDATNNTYNYTCDLANKRYYLSIPPDAITDGMQNVVWQCLAIVGQGSNMWSFTLSGT